MGSLQLTKGPFKWYRKAARLEADREVDLPARAYRKGRGIVLNQYGLASFFALFVMVLFCVNYSSNTGLICACLLTMAWVCAILANHWVMARVVLQHISVACGDEEDPGQIEMLWRIKSSVRPVFWLTVDGQVARVVFDKDGWARVRWKPLPRKFGRYAFPTIRLSTSWPMSIGFSWFILKPSRDIVIAPHAPSGSGQSGDQGEFSSDTKASSGDPEGIKPRSPQDFSARWAWKPTVRLGRPMTYEWSQAGQDIVHITWASDIDPTMALRKLRGDLSVAVANNQSFQISHPWGRSVVLHGEQAALNQVCQIGHHALSRVPWGQGVPTQPGYLGAFLGKFIKKSKGAL